MELADDDSRLPGIEALQLVGGRLALDFVNTANWVDDSAIDDRLSVDNGLLRWAAHVGLRPTVERDEIVDSALIRNARLAIRELFLDSDHHSTSTIEDHIAFHQNATPSPSNFVLLAVLFSAIELSTSSQLDAVKSCPGPRCGWLFVDQSPSGRRRWCSMATCGNRSKSNQHYKRRQAATSET